jgi:hypothetical protein
MGLVAPAIFVAGVFLRQLYTRPRDGPTNRIIARCRTSFRYSTLRQMQDLQAMKTALRVLMAIGERRQPDWSDVELLRSLAPPTAGASLEELACEVIQMALKNRALVRSAGNIG